MSAKNKITAFLMATGLSLAATAQSYTVLHDDYGMLQLRLTTERPTLGEVVVDKETYTTLHLDGYMPSATVGAPCLPTFAGLIEVPVCEGLSIEVSDATFDTLPPLPHRLLPTQPSRSKSDTTVHPLVVDPKQYTVDAFLGGTAHVAPAGTARDRRLAHLSFSPVQYNPVSGTLVVCRSANLTVRYHRADTEATHRLFNRYHSPAFASGAASLNSLYPKSVSTTAPIRYLIVAHSMFRNQLDSFVEWKRRKGFITDIVYTDDPGVGSDTTSLAAYLRSQYTNATASQPAPTYLLLVGDVAQIPPFQGRTSNEHITDLYYSTWSTGDHLPDCYCGRFSAQSISQLTPQIAKTLMYEQYTFADPSFLDRAVLVAGVDGGESDDFGYTHADPAMDYAITNYINGGHGFSSVNYFKNNTSIVPTGSNVHIDGNSTSMSATVRTSYNQGAGLINYSAHGSPTSWGTPNFTTTHVAGMTNSQKFGIMIGNCCLTNKFEISACLGEALLRRGDYCGAVGYIGGSNSTYWNEDFYWAVGLRSGIGASMSMAYNSSRLGVYDRLCHTHNEAYPQWATSQGSILAWGNMAVESSTSSRKHYYWEIYHLMGDPSVMPYLTQASTIDINAASYLLYGTTSLPVGTAPYAYVALTDTLTHALVASAVADGNGAATLLLPAGLPAGGYELAVSAQQRRTSFHAISVILPDGPFPSLVSALPQGSLVAGSTRPISLAVTNMGNATAHGIALTIASADPSSITFAPAAIALDSLAAGDTVLLAVTATVDSLAIDGAKVTLESLIDWNGSPVLSSRDVVFTLDAPLLVADLRNAPRNMQPGQTTSFAIPVVNRGHAAQPTGRMHIASPTALLDAGAPSIPFGLPTSASVTYTATLHADSLLPRGIDIPVTLYAGSRPVAQTAIYIGETPTETFEGNSLHTSGWTHGTHPWQITSEKSHQGNASLRSAAGLEHNQTSELTLGVQLTTDDSLSFYYSVSSESNYDKFILYLDNTEVLSTSGTVDWTSHALPIPAGSHTLRFSYTKDHSVSSGSDCAWIDDLQLPRSSAGVTFLHTDLCQGDTYTLGTDTIDTHLPASGSLVVHTTDTTVSLVDYVVHPTADTTLCATACDSYTFLGTPYTASDSLVATLATSHGCDSTVTLLLTIHHSASDTVVIDTTASSYLWNGTSYQQSGVYEQQLTSTEGCDSTVTLVLTLESPIGIADIIPDDITVSPNPTSAVIRLSRPVAQAEVYDIQGRLLLRLESTNRIDLATLPAGSYTLRLKTEAGTTVRRVNKSH